MVLSETEVTNGSKGGRVKTLTGSRNAASRVGMWVIGYQLSSSNGETRYLVWYSTLPPRNY